MKQCSRFVCSICIPTYNRASLLRNTLNSIASATSFSEGKVEVVISNNASPDHTHAVCEEFRERFPDRVCYIPLPDPIDSHHNFENALNHGHGTYLKLQNDNHTFKDGALDHLVEGLEKYGDMGNLFLPEYPGIAGEYAVIHSVEELVSQVSFATTSINILCIRNETYHSLETPFRAWETHFPHVDILFRLLNRGEKAIRLPRIYMHWQRVLYNSKKRNNAQEFAVHYIGLLDEQRLAGNLSSKTFQREKMRTLFKQTIPLHFDFFHQYNDSQKIYPFFPYMHYYWKDWFFYASLPWIAFYWFTSNVIPIHQALGAAKRKIRRIREKAQDI